MFSLNDIQQIVNEKYVDEINEIIKDYVESLFGEELTGVFDFSVDFVECEIESEPRVISNKEEKYDNQIEISGILEVNIVITAFVQWEDEDIPHDSVERNVLADFIVYCNGEQFEDFHIIDIYL